MERQTIESLLKGHRNTRPDRFEDGTGDLLEWVHRRHILDEALDVLDNPDACEHHRILLENADRQAERGSRLTRSPRSAESADKPNVNKPHRKV